MTDVATRYRRVAAGMTRRVDGASSSDWERPAPPQGWVARDVVAHLVSWFPPFLHQGAGIDLPPGPSVDADPAGAWRALDRGVQAVLDDPAVCARRFVHPVAGEHRVDDAIGRFFLGDVLVHTWDLARATGQDETLDRAEVSSLLAGILPMDDALRASGHYGPKVPVPDDADEQTRLIAFTGRHP